MTIDLKGRVALVTGGSRGIGAATVKAFADAGARVVFSYYRAERAARALERELNDRETPAVAVRADVSRMSDAKKLVETTLRRFGRLDVLVANAGIWNAESVPVEKLGERDWDRTCDINLKGVYAVVHYAVPHMKKRKSGRIIVVSSTAAQRGEAFHADYAASKGGLVSFVKSLSTELAPHQILVNCIAPGWVATDMARPVVRNRREYRKALAPIPLGRFARPEEVAGPILFLASDLATFITGEVMNVNGGSVLCG
jgi:3-oxoacyl-[acyl-carrier protein] reductase